VPPERSGRFHGRHEVHEHVVVEGATAKLRNPLIHHNVESLSRYIQKHDEYSNWESHVLLQRTEDKELPPSLFGTQAQRRRWLKRKLFAAPGSPVLLFLYRYVVRFGFLDGVPGLIYCGFSGGSNVSHQIQDLRTETKAEAKE